MTSTIDNVNRVSDNMQHFYLVYDLTTKQVLQAYSSIEKVPIYMFSADSTHNAAYDKFLEHFSSWNGKDYMIGQVGIKRILISKEDRHVEGFLPNYIISSCITYQLMPNTSPTEWRKVYIGCCCNLNSIQAEIDNLICKVLRVSLGLGSAIIVEYYLVEIDEDA